MNIASISTTFWIHAVIVIMTTIAGCGHVATYRATQDLRKAFVSGAWFGVILVVGMRSALFVVGYLFGWSKLM